MSFKPGDKVICIKYYLDKIEGLHIEKNRILNIRNCELDTDGQRLLLRFEEIISAINPYTGQEFGYDAIFFAPFIEPLTGFVEMTYTKIIEQIPIGQS